jgi:hypothetical protein
MKRIKKTIEFKVANERRFWIRKPIEQVVQSKKIYSRKKVNKNASL